MDFKKCALCEKLFASSGSSICPDCFEKLDEVYQKARTAIRDNRKERLSVSRIAEIIEEDELYINLLVKDGRIEMGSSEEKDVCSMCGAPVQSGETYCRKCRESLMSGFGKKSDKKGSGMFTQERRRK